MKMRIAIVSLLVILYIALGSTAVAGILYSNGPVNGTSDAYFFDSVGNFIVSDQFTPSGSGMTGFSIAEWVDAGAVPLAFDWSVGSAAFGSDLGSGVATVGSNANALELCASGAPFNGGTCGGGYGYDVYQIDVTTGLITVGAGDWLTLSYGTESDGGRVAWDVNYGPSQAQHSYLGSIPSETFTINGAGGGVPEPSSMMLFGSGILALAGLLRRKLVR